MANRIYGILFLIFAGFASAYSQEYQSFSAGPFISFKGGLNGGSVMQGRKNALAFVKTPDFGVTSLTMLSAEHDLGVVCDLACSSYGYKIKGVDVNKEYTLSYTYITLGPAFYFSGFTFGFNFGVPIAADFGSKIKSSKLALMSEFKVGYMYPLMLEKESSLNIFINAGYMLSGMYKKFTKDDPLLPYIPEVEPYKISSKYNPRALSVSIGFSYLFSIDGEQLKSPPSSEL
jgi:hypothetical protein